MILDRLKRRKGRVTLIPNLYSRRGRKLLNSLQRQKGRKKRKKLLGQGYQARVYRKDAFAVRKQFKRYPFISRRKRVEQEANVLKRLRGTGIAPKLYETGNDYIDMEFVPGQTLRSRSRGDARRQKRYGRQLARKVKGMHDRGVMHRDLHDKNIVITNRNKIKILDYGNAKAVDGMLTRRERTGDIKRVLKSHRGRDQEPLRQAFVKEYRLESVK